MDIVVIYPHIKIYLKPYVVLSNGGSDTF